MNRSATMTVVPGSLPEGETSRWNGGILTVSTDLEGLQINREVQRVRAELAATGIRTMRPARNVAGRLGRWHWATPGGMTLCGAQLHVWSTEDAPAAADCRHCLRIDNRQSNNAEGTAGGNRTVPSTPQAHTNEREERNHDAAQPADHAPRRPRPGRLRSVADGVDVCGSADDRNGCPMTAVTAPVPVATLTTLQGRPLPFFAGQTIGVSDRIPVHVTMFGSAGGPGIVTQVRESLAEVIEVRAVLDGALGRPEVTWTVPDPSEPDFLMSEPIPVPGLPGVKAWFSFTPEDAVEAMTTGQVPSDVLAGLLTAAHDSLPARSQ